MAEKLEIGAAEQRATMLARGLSDDIAAWQALMECAFEVVKSQDFSLQRDVESWYDAQQARDELASARVLDNAAQFAPNLGGAHARRLGLQAALAFAMQGNFPTASAIVQRTFPNLRPQSDDEAWLMLCAAPALWEHLRIDASFAACKYLQALKSFLNHGDDASAENLRAAWQENAARCDWQAWQIGEAAAQWALEHTIFLSTARVLNQAHIGPREWRQKLLDDGLFSLLPPQRAAVACGLVGSRENAIVSLPPGTGKTLLGELCVISALQDGENGWACFVVPYVALGRQVAHALESHSANTRVHRWLGGHERDEFAPEKRAEIVVVTPESLDAALRRKPELRQSLRVVVCDEAHSIGADARGVRLESLLTRLRASQDAPRLVLLSAAIRRTQALQSWMKAPDENVLRADWCATARYLALWTRDGALTWFHDARTLHAKNVVQSEKSKKCAISTGVRHEQNGEILSLRTQRFLDCARLASHCARDDAFQTASEDDWVLGRAQLPWPNRELAPTDDWVAMQRGAEAVRTNIAHLVRHLDDRFGGPILAVCATRRGARDLALAFGDLPVRIGGENIARAQELIRTQFRFLAPLLPLLERGACWHHAGLPNALREVIEAAIKSGEIIAVAATTTLAEGVDFPFRWTILVDWLQWHDGRQRPMSPYVFRNIVGRCGRAGQWTQGDTIVFDNPLGDARFTGDDQRTHWLRYLCLQPAPAQPRGALERRQIARRNAEKLPSQKRANEAERAALSNQWFAFVVEQLRDAQDNLDGAMLSERFVKSSFHAAPLDAQLQSELECEWKSWLEGDNALLQQNASGFEVSALGQAIYAGDWSPDSALRALKVLRVINPLQLEVWQGAEVAAHLCLELGDIAEQENLLWRRIARRERHRFALKRRDVVAVFAGCLNGQAPETLFAALPSVRDSTRAPRFVDWLHDATMADEIWHDWHSDLDKWAEWLRSVPQTFAPQLLRATALLCPFVGLSDQSARWLRWAAQLEIAPQTQVASEENALQGVVA